MPRIFEGQTFESILEGGSGKTYSDLEFRRCRFVGSALSITTKPRHRSIVRNVRIIECEERGCSLWTPIVEEVLIDGLKTSDTLMTKGAVFKHVTLRGRIGRVLVSPLVRGGLATPAEQHAFDGANAAFYANTDWALDIRQAEFEEADLRGVPGHLVRRDPETQVLVTRQKAQEGRWQQLDLARTYWPTALRFFLEGPLDAIVLVAPKRFRGTKLWTFQSLLEGLRLLRAEGIAEPD